MDHADSRPDDTGRHRHTVLVVDDEPINRMVLEGVLPRHLKVISAASGIKALELAVGEPRPDLILLDIMMPDMDGFEVLKRLREEPATRDIPVILVTALIDEDSEQRGFGMGAADYIHKPIHAAIVNARVQVQLEAKAARDMLDRNNQRLRHKVESGAQALEKAQLQLMQAEKMASLGQLAAGIAHEINNPVGFVGSNLGSLETYVRDLLALVDAYERGAQQVADPAPFAEAAALRGKLDYAFLCEDILSLLRESAEGVDRVRKIVSDLKDYSHTSAAEWHWADLHLGLESTLNMARNQLKYHCTVVKEFGELPPVYCLGSQLNQVFMNLIVNAAQAIQDQGEIRLRTGRQGDDRVWISVTDTGKGIPAEDLQRIFEPFYTTKPVGQGTGLGLSLSWGIVERHHGRIDVSSEVGKGTTFTVILPIEPPPEAVE
ncbi:ATP-binding protein [Zoogloea sp.]|uniref:ATP-binding protein n=1 Tax=Zoogloea sp. TaxID=49181 RepID=UPI0025D21BA3|nr:ATP-binding protein [Zoogloea sp.]MCK6393508.1 ATP-binding protein [Zoogloea sp.]